MKWIAALLVTFQLLVWPSAGLAQDRAATGHTYRTVSTTTWVEEWDDAQQRWVRVADEAKAAVTARGNSPARIAQPRAIQPWMTKAAGTVPLVQTTRTYQAARYAYPPTTPRRPVAIAQYGPFVVLGQNRAAMIGSTDSVSPRHFDAMLRDYPDLLVLEMIEAPGTSNDIANLAVGRRIRAAGLSTHVPRGGSVRSGAVELFLAGKERRVDDGAQFAVHSWLDNYGRQPADFAPEAPENRLYLDYYREMGMSEVQARAFYSMTNSVPHSSAKWLNADDMRRWIAPDRAPAHAPVRTPAFRMAAASHTPGAPRQYAKSDWTIAAIQPSPLALPELPPEIVPAFGPAMVSIAGVRPIHAAKPVIGYGDVASLTLASTLTFTVAGPGKEFARAKGHAFLDS
ncbi:MAG: hypothetical protein WBA51_07830 [Erythrobacter sp.]